jgi:hypothetical protein
MYFVGAIKYAAIGKLAAVFLAVALFLLCPSKLTVRVVQPRVSSLPDKITNFGMIEWRHII